MKKDLLKAHSEVVVSDSLETYSFLVLETPNGEGIQFLFDIADVGQIDMENLFDIFPANYDMETRAKYQRLTSELFDDNTNLAIRDYNLQSKILMLTKRYSIDLEAGALYLSVPRIKGAFLFFLRKAGYSSEKEILLYLGEEHSVHIVSKIKDLYALHRDGLLKNPNTQRKNLTYVVGDYVLAGWQLKEDM